MASPLTGQVSLSGTAQQISSSTSANSFTVKAPTANAATAYIGGSGVTTANGFPLDPGETFEYERSSLQGQPTHQISPADVYVVGTSGDKIGWFAD